MSFTSAADLEIFSETIGIFIGSTWARDFTHNHRFVFQLCLYDYNKSVIILNIKDKSKHSLTSVWFSKNSSTSIPQLHSSARSGIGLLNSLFLLVFLISLSSSPVPPASSLYQSRSRLLWVWARHTTCSRWSCAFCDDSFRRAISRVVLPSRLLSAPDEYEWGLPDKLFLAIFSSEWDWGTEEKPVSCAILLRECGEDADRWNDWISAAVKRGFPLRSGECLTFLFGALGTVWANLTREPAKYYERMV